MKAQNGFRENKSLDIAIKSFTERIQEELDMGLKQIAYFVT